MKIIKNLHFTHNNDRRTVAYPKSGVPLKDSIQGGVGFAANNRLGCNWPIVTKALFITAEKMFHRRGSRTLLCLDLYFEKGMFFNQSDAKKS